MASNAVRNLNVTSLVRQCSLAGIRYAEVAHEQTFNCLQQVEEKWLSCVSGFRLLLVDIFREATIQACNRALAITGLLERYGHPPRLFGVAVPGALALGIRLRQTGTGFRLLRQVGTGCQIGLEGGRLASPALRPFDDVAPPAPASSPSSSHRAAFSSSANFVDRWMDIRWSDAPDASPSLLAPARCRS